MKKLLIAALALCLSQSLISQTLWEGFENLSFPPAGWSLQNPDGGSGWERQEAGLIPIPYWPGGSVISAPFNGGVGVAYATWKTGGLLENDQWLITPQFTPQSGDFLNFWVRKYGGRIDTLEIKLSTSGDTIPDFSVLLGGIYYMMADSGFEYKSYDLSAWVGQAIHIAFREKVSDNFIDGAAIFLDNVHVGTPNSVTAVNNRLYVNVFPNPATDYLDVDTDIPVIAAKLFNIVGQVVYTGYPSSKNFRIELNALAAGIYSLQLQTENGLVVRKIRISR